MPEGWKTYWRTPGDAGGVPPSFDWSKSENLAAATVLYPAPKRFSDRAGDTVGYKGTVVFPVRLTAKDPGKPIDLRLSLEYGVCKEICIPAEAALSLAVSPEKGSEVPDELATALKQVPAPEAERRPGDPVLKHVVTELSGAKPSIVLDAEFPSGSEHCRSLHRGAAGTVRAAAEEDVRRRLGPRDVRGRSVPGCRPAGA